MNVKLVAPLAGVTVTLDVPAEPTDGVIVPPWLPSLMVTVCEPLNVAPDKVTVKFVDATFTVPLDGPLTDRLGLLVPPPQLVNPLGAVAA